MDTSTTVQPKLQAVTFSSIDLWVLFLVTVWGVNFVLIKSALNEFSALGFNALRFGVGTLLMLVLWRIFEGHVRIARGDWPKIALLGIVGNTLYQLPFILAIKLSTASNTSLIVATGPIWIALLSALLKLDRLTWRSWLGIALSFVGLYVIITANGNVVLGSQTLFGDLLMLGGAIAWAIYTVLARPLLRKYSSTTFTTWTMAVGAPAVFLAGVPDLLQTNFLAISSPTWLILLFSATFAISIGYIIWNAGVHRLGQARTATYANLTPIIALTIGAVLLAEPVSLAKLIGAGVVLVGVTITRRG
ncbi:MAG: DMT family transporter [Chloroflexota bacterium]